MSKGVLIHLEDKKEFLDEYQRIFVDLNIGLEYVPCLSVEEFNEATIKYDGHIKSIIFDLVGKKVSEEELTTNPEFLDLVQQNFANYNLPIFIYSGRLDVVRDMFNENGSVFKLSKDYEIKIIFDKIRLYLDSGFINVFCTGGFLETEVKNELHKSFTNQFSENSQIDGLIESILASESDPEKQILRIKNVFKRITIRALATDLLAPVADGEEKVHPIEHFYKRQSKLKIWTGDIWKNKKGINVIVLTPRCDFATGSAVTVIYCEIEPLSKPIELKGNAKDVNKRLRDYLNDNLQGKSQRYIPGNTFFPEGGMANMKLYRTLEIEEFLTNYEYVVTLSDDLTNELIGKFAYYFLRTGITNISEQEFEAIVQAMYTDDVKK